MIDLDAEIARTYRRSPKQIIEEEGIAAFRKIESQVLKLVLSQNTARGVIALGGGAWTLASNRALIEDDGAVSVWLDTPFELCWQRIVNSGSERPLARNESQARALYEERRASYSTATLHIDAIQNKSAHQVANEIIQALPDNRGRDDKGLVQALLGDGRPLLTFTGLSLVLAGAFALFLSATGHFLPHDVQFLGFTPEQLCSIKDCRIVYFMFHDRVAFGGALISIGALYMWLAEFPLRQGEAWAWWLFVVAGISGFGSFLAYLGYGYLDTWHGIATLFLLPLFILGLARFYPFVNPPNSPRSLLRPGVKVSWRTAFGVGRALLLATAAGMVAGGFTVMIVGMTRVFVPQDLEFMGLDPVELKTISPFLVPLIAHDRAGFGGAICTAGLTVFFSVWCARPSRSLWQVLCFSGLVGFAAAIGIHPVVGYTDLFHLSPAILGAVIFILGLVLSFRPMHFKIGRWPLS